MNKTNYFVSMSNTEVTEAPMPGHGQFEIIATKEDVLEIENRFKSIDDETKSGLKYLARPFHEEDVDQKRHEGEEELIQIYRLLYKHGTAKTKEDIDSFGILNK